MLFAPEIADDKFCPKTSTAVFDLTIGTPPIDRTVPLPKSPLSDEKSLFTNLSTLANW